MIKGLQIYQIRLNYMQKLPNLFTEEINLPKNIRQMLNRN